MLSTPVQFNNVVDFDERITMVGDSGTAYLTGDDVRKVDVSNWTPIWTKSNSNLEPVAPLRNNRVAMHNLSTGMLEVLDSTGMSIEVGAFGGRWGYQSGFGLWTEVSSMTATLSARFSLAVNEAPNSFKYLGATGAQQNAVVGEQLWASRELAALLALEFIYPTSANTNWEYGGLICQQGTKFRWSELVTSENQSNVFISDNLCPPTSMAARFHTHPPKENAFPLAGDYSNANGYLGIPFYLMAPAEWSSPPWPPQRQWFLKYWRDGSRQSEENLCQRVAGMTWMPKISGANCATPTP